MINIKESEKLMPLNHSCAHLLAEAVKNKEVDLGIVKYHFEISASKENFNWIKK